MAQPPEEGRSQDGDRPRKTVGVYARPERNRRSVGWLIAGAVVVAVGGAVAAIQLF